MQHLTSRARVDPSAERFRGRVFWPKPESKKRSRSFPPIRTYEDRCRAESQLGELDERLQAENRWREEPRQWAEVNLGMPTETTISRSQDDLPLWHPDEFVPS
jgi:hypothetical protein